MIEHIVRMNEKVDSILNTYQIGIEELKENNLHITDFSKLQCGMKLLIPYLSKNVEQILESTEGFVQKYYPKVTEVVSEQIKEEVRKNEDIKPEILKEKVDYPEIQKKKYPGVVPPQKPYKGNVKI